MPQPLTNPTSPGQRIAIVTRCFWPISGPTELAVAKLANELKSAGHTVEIFTLRWQKGWPSKLSYSEIPVHRVSKPTSGPWGSFRSTRGLARLLVDFQPTGIIAFGCGEETWSLARTFAGQIPIVVRMDQHLIASDASPRMTRMRQAEAYSAANAILADCSVTAQQVLHVCPDAATKIQTVPDLFDTVDPADRTIARQSESRNALAEAHPVLNTETGHPLVVCASPLTDDGGVFDLVRAWPRVAEQFPKARLWLLGQGPRGQAVWDEINELDLVYTVIMPGFFDDLCVVLLAADLYVHPLRDIGYDSNLSRAILAGVCPIGTQACQTAGTILDNETGLIVPPENTCALGDAISNTLARPDLRQRLGTAGHRRHAASQQAENVLAQYLAGFNAATIEPLSASSG